MAQPAVADFDFHLFRAQRTWVKTKGLQGAIGTRGSVSFEFLHNEYSLFGYELLLIIITRIPLRMANCIRGGGFSFEKLRFRLSPRY